MERPIERHPFEPFLPAGARMLFLGSFPPQPRRWCMPFYYPNWINDFWRIMGLIHFGDKDHFCLTREKRFDEASIRRFCADAGLAFYDTACAVRRLRDNASDAFLEVVTPTDIPALLERIPHCRTLITTGEKATGVVAERFRCPVPGVGEYVDIETDGVARARLCDVGTDGVACARLCDVGTDGVAPDGLCATGMDGQARISQDTAGRLRFWRMPSSSRAYPLSLERKADFYSRLFF
jgi:G:T/U-mismatch repair DNA glycosylase